MVSNHVYNPLTMVVSQKSPKWAMTKVTNHLRSTRSPFKYHTLDGQNPVPPKPGIMIPMQIATNVMVFPWFQLVRPLDGFWFVCLFVCVCCLFSCSLACFSRLQQETSCATILWMHEILHYLRNPLVQIPTSLNHQ